MDKRKERNEVGFTNNFQFAVYEELLKLFSNSSDKAKGSKNQEFCKKITNKISEGISPEVVLVDWKNKKSSDRNTSIIIEVILL